MEVQYLQDYHNRIRFWSDYFSINREEVNLIKAVFPLSNKDILEIGCGNGRLSAQISPLCKTIIGIDQDKIIIDKLNNTLPNASFFSHSAESLPYNDESFDMVLMPWMLHQVNNKINAIKEAFRVLRRGGKLLVFALLSNCDYDKIARHFAKTMDKTIDPQTFYIEPIASVFGNIEINNLSNDNDAFCFLFPNCTIALQAFLFALEAWHNTKLNQVDIDHLRHIIQQYSHGNYIKLETKGVLYSANKN
jgi:ubiquinone/menaquinone biosynthesis C-methylase UbiE